MRYTFWVYPTNQQHGPHEWPMCDNAARACGGGPIAGSSQPPRRFSFNTSRLRGAVSHRFLAQSSFGVSAAEGWQGKRGGVWAADAAERLGEFFFGQTVVRGWRLCPIIGLCPMGFCLADTCVLSSAFNIMVLLVCKQGSLCTSSGLSRGLYILGYSAANLTPRCNTLRTNCKYFDKQLCGGRKGLHLGLKSLLCVCAVRCRGHPNQRDEAPVVS